MMHDFYATDPFGGVFVINGSQINLVSHNITLPSHRTQHVFNEMMSPCIAGQKDEVNNSSRRIVVLTGYVTSLVFLASYSAFLIASLAVQPLVLPFRDLKGLVYEGSYKLGVLDHTSTINIFDV
jgi:hypothetical protein